jgi:HlyD family secretion protein
MRKLLLLLVILLACGGWAYMKIDLKPAMPEFKTEKVHRGDIRATVSATGTLEPEEVVDVGAQVAGQIIAFGTDLDNSARPINYGSRVEQGTLLAQIDDSLFKARADQARASLKRAEADVQFAQARTLEAERDWKRGQKLRASPGAITDLELDKMQSNQDTARASLAQSRASVAAARASLAEAETNLGYTRIVSPVKGVIIDRRVNVGQTVVSALNAPSLFLIAKDLSRMEIWASVNEADIGNIHEHQKVRFKVAAYPGKEFVGQVSQIRYNATMTSSVVTYTVVVTFDNSSYKLPPYLTANLQFEVDEHKGVLEVPNSVLRWRPLREQVKEEYRELFDEFLAHRGNSADQPRALLWRLDGTALVPIQVRPGLTDGTDTEIISDELHEGDEVVSGVHHPTADGSGGKGNQIVQMKRKKL